MSVKSEGPMNTKLDIDRVLDDCAEVFRRKHLPPAEMLQAAAEAIEHALDTGEEVRLWVSPAIVCSLLKQRGFVRYDPVERNGWQMDYWAQLESDMHCADVSGSGWYGGVNVAIYEKRSQRHGGE